MVDIEKLLHKTQGVRYLQYHFTDATGKLRCMEETAHRTVPNFCHGLGIDGSSIPGYAKVDFSDVLLKGEVDTIKTIDYEGEKLSRYAKVDFSDVLLKGEVDTIKTIDYEGEKLSRVMCHVENPDGSLSMGDPRSILSRVVEQYHEIGIEPLSFSEIEYFYFESDGKTPYDKGSYLCSPPEDRCDRLRRDVVRYLEDLGAKVRRAHHECAHGQNEIEMFLQPALKNCDDTLTAMWLIENLAMKKDIKVGFSPKPLPKQSGNGLHQHISLVDLHTGKNVMNKDEVSKEFSDIGKHFIAGVIKYSRDIAAVFARNDETFKRFTAGQEAPVWSFWAHSNRNAVLRIPATPPKDLRVEFRAGDASGSVHLLNAIIFAAGLKGIKDKLACPPETKISPLKMTEEERKASGIAKLPCSKEECIEILKSSELIRETLGGLTDWLIHPVAGHD
ncbi:hypothetical protein ADUPG1_010762 [Aduncisulcus paluster]|uniref:Lengsin n=1 Tax=Aduncisulcus paluster TaxID=2918883 RepID=A0ABQ5JX90_9EUKA|nr:hypothetical protein ADUPG1_010762 [Aduncisulcus paluster]